MVVHGTSSVHPNIGPTRTVHEFEMLPIARKFNVLHELLSRKSKYEEWGVMSRVWQEESACLLTIPKRDTCNLYSLYLPLSTGTRL